MEFEVKPTERVICTKCGIAFGRRKGNFYTSYAESYRGIGYLPICKNCVEDMFQTYLEQCKDVKMAVRQMCRKLDLYWNETLCDRAMLKSVDRTMMVQYLGKINAANHARKSYDTSLIESGLLWNFDLEQPPEEESQDEVVDEVKLEPEVEIPKEVISFWGEGYSPKQYDNLQSRLDYWKSRLGTNNVEDFDIGTETLIKQICAIELDISNRRAANQSVDKQITLLNTLLGSANLKPVQKKQDDADFGINNTPLGVWIYRFENQRPLPEIDEDLKDVNKIKKYVFTWMGHLCKMLGIKNGYSELYDEAIREYSVEKPEYDGDDDEFVFGGDPEYDDEE